MKKLFTPFVLWYLRNSARLQLMKANPIVIGIAGSSGKSSLVTLIMDVLSDNYSVLSGEGKNSETGIPLGILRIKMKNYRVSDWIQTLIKAKLAILFNWKKYDIYIAEMGIDSPVEPKNMSYLLKIIKPSIGMVTNVSLEHSMYFDSFVNTESEVERHEKILKMTAEQETLLLKSLPSYATAIVNLDDSFLKASIPNIHAKKITLSLHDKKADLHVSNISSSLSNFSMKLHFDEKSFILNVSQLLPEFYAYEFLFVLATCISLGIPLSQTLKSIEKHFSLPPGRFSILNGIKNSTIIDSSYNNATLEPIIGILETLIKVKGKKRLLAIVGDMRELGSQSKASHETLAEKLLTSVDEAILIGPMLKQYTVPILKKKKFPFQHFDTFTQAKEAILSSTRPNDIILVKSSQNTLFLERAVELLLADKNDISKLCRRGEFWDAQREETS